MYSAKTRLCNLTSMLGGGKRGQLSGKDEADRPASNSQWAGRGMLKNHNLSMWSLTSNVTLISSVTACGDHAMQCILQHSVDMGGQLKLGYYYY